MIIKQKKKPSNRFGFYLKYYEFFQKLKKNWKKKCVKKNTKNFLNKKTKKTYMSLNTNNVYFLKKQNYIFFLKNFFFCKKFHIYKGICENIKGTKINLPLSNNFYINTIIHNNFLYPWFLKKNNNLIGLYNTNTGDLLHHVKSYKKNYISLYAGCFILILKYDFFNNKITIKMNSGKQYTLNNNTWGFLGRCSNPNYKKIKYGCFKKKLFYTNKGFSVRGCAKNPVDHHNGGRTKKKKKSFSIFNKIAKKNK